MVKKMKRNKTLKITITVSDVNRFYAECEKLENISEYGIYLYRNGDLVERSYYTDNNTMVFWPTEPGVYYVQVIAIDSDNNKIIGNSEKVYFNGIYDTIDMDTDNPKKQSMWQAVQNALQENVQHFERTVRVAYYDYTSRDRDSYLGLLWSILNPVIQVGTFWFVFGFGVRQGAPVDGYPFVVWMLCGLIPWFFINNGIVHGASAVYAKASLVLRLRYPKSTLPVSSILTVFYEHIILNVIMFIMFVFFNIYPSLYCLNLIYYNFFAFTFLVALAFATSTLTMIARDFQKLINALIRLLFYITPILWTIDTMPRSIQVIMQANPFLYIISGYRDSILYKVNFWEHPLRIIFFWGVTMFIAMYGCNLQQRYKDQFIDML